MGILFAIYNIGLLTVASIYFGATIKKPPTPVRLAGQVEVVFGVIIFLLSYNFVINNFRWLEYYLFSMIGVVWIFIAYWVLKGSIVARKILLFLSFLRIFTVVASIISIITIYLLYFPSSSKSFFSSQQK